ncbi:MAG: transglycosylase SLT domain-containing protein [Bdellovibrionales bacterium]|nr:transglycosylase SLT domain-containing protein [Bdellovibrionales bacterium]
MRVLIPGLLLAFAAAGVARAGSGPTLPSEHFPVDEAMRIRVNFWKRVYTEISSGEAYLHDEDDLRVIYKKISIADLSPRQRREFVRREKKAIGDQLRTLARKGGQNLTPAEESLAGIVGEQSKRRLLEMARAVRSQQGLTDRYYEGLVRSYLYLEQIKDIFREEGLPPELGYLPHVESSFNYRAYSKVGAAGIWQFMRPTARLYRLKLNYVIDERRDPLKATRAAARFLRDSYNKLGAWPLALTAYNHGPRSIERAVRTVGSRDLSKIIENYGGRRFGFASKNFYATYVATAEISMDPERYFPKVPRAKLPESSELHLPKPLTIRQISKMTGVTEDDLQTFNRELRPVAFKAHVYLPKGHRLLIPTTDSDELAELASRLAGAAGGPEDLKSGGTHIVSRGESLSELARLYRVGITDLIMLNQIENPSRVMPGTQLRIPETGRPVAAARPVLIAQLDPKPKQTPRPRPREREVPAAPAEPQPPPSAPPPVLADAGLAPESESSMLDEADVEALVSVQEEILRQSPVTRGFRELLERAPQLHGRRAGSLRERLLSRRSEIQKIDAVVIEEAAEREEKTQAPPDFDPGSYELEAVAASPGIYVVTVEPDETLGHFADWARAPVARLQSLNGLGRGRNIRVGQRLKVPVREGQLIQFNLGRLQFHQAVEEDLFQSYRVTGLVDYKVRRGDSIDSLTRKLDVPLWLLRKYQDQDLGPALTVGQLVKIPQLAPLTAQVPPAGAGAAGASEAQSTDEPAAEEAGTVE